jgi:lambda family phage tail tape measure protein
MAANERFILDFVTRGVDNIDKAADKVQALNRQINGLSTALLGVSFGAFIKGAFDAADRLSDMSDATNISIASLKGLESAMNAAGGNGKNLEKSINTLFASIEAANGGSDNLRNAFAKVGVSMSDLKNLSEADILQKTLEGLAKLPAGAERSALAAQLLSKSFRSVDPKQLIDALDPEKFLENEKAIKQAAETTQKLQKTFEELQLAAINALTPLAKMLGETELNAEAAEKIIKALGITFGLAFGVNILASIVAINSALGITAGLGVLIGRTPIGALATLATILAGTGGSAFDAAVGIKDLNKQNEDLIKNAKGVTLGLEDAAEARRKFAATDERRTGFGKIKSAVEQLGPANREQGQSAADKARLESAKRTEDSIIETRKLAMLSGANELQAIEINAAFEVAKAVNEIRNKENLSVAQQNKEIVAKTQAINYKAANDTAKYRMEQNAKVFQVEEEERQKIQDELKAEADRLEKIFATGRKITENTAEQNREMAAKAKLTLDTATMTDRERANAEELFKIEQERLALLKQIADTYGNEQFAKRTAEEKKINDLLGKRKEDAIANQEATARQQEDFSAGWQKAYRQYVESGNNSFDQAGRTFSTLTRGFEDSMVKFVQTGKLSFKDLFNSLIAEAVRAQSNKLITSLLGSLFGSFGGGSTPFGGSVFGGAYGGAAIGGPIDGPTLVGERGPEMFIPKGSGTIVPNDKLFGGGNTNVTNVTYSIQAVDASSFRSMLARDPEFIHNVAEQGRRQLPIRSRR